MSDSEEEGPFRYVEHGKVKPDDDPPVGTMGRYLGVTNDHGAWYSVPGYSVDKLQVTNRGYLRIWHPKNGWGKPTLGSLTDKGYRRVTIDHKNRQVHDLLTTTLYGVKSDALLTAQHGPGGRADNSFDNLLGWATKSEQINEHRRKPAIRRDSKPILVWKVDGLEKDATRYESVCEAYKVMGIRNLHKVANGTYEQAGGYKAKWIPPSESQDNLPGYGYAPAHSLSEHHKCRLA